MTSRDILDIIGQLKELAMPEPCICGVYFLVSRKAVVYVGASTDILQRVRSHWKPGNEGGKEFDEVRYIEFPNFEEAEKCERELIRELQPPLNKYIPGGRV